MSSSGLITYDWLYSSSDGMIRNMTSVLWRIHVPLNPTYLPNHCSLSAITFASLFGDNSGAKMTSLFKDATILWNVCWLLILEIKLKKQSIQSRDQFKDDYKAGKESYRQTSESSDSQIDY